MQIILKVRGVKSILIRDFPGTLFCSNSETESNAKINISSNSFNISIPLNKLYEDDQQFSNYIDALINFLNENHIKTTFFIFGSFKNQSFNELSNKYDLFIKPEEKNRYTNLQFYSINSYKHSLLMQTSDLVIIFEGSKYGLDLTPEIIQAASINKPVIVYKHGCVCEIFRNSNSAFFFENKNDFINIFKKILIQKEIDLHSINADNRNLFNWTETWNNSILNFIQNKN